MISLKKVITSTFCVALFSLVCGLSANARSYSDVLNSREPTYDWYMEFTDYVSKLPDDCKPCTLDKYFTKDEVKLFYGVVAAEIGSDYYSFDQKVNVASVIIHRWINDGSRSLMNVLTPSQFSTLKNGRAYTVKVSAEVRAACQYAMWFDGDYDGALYFNNARSWDGIYKYLGYDGAHYYYR